MFTGIIVELGEVYDIKKLGNSAKLNILSEKVIKDASIGDSISVNGVCLTVTEIERKRGIISFDVSNETLQKTTTGELKKSSPVNLEPALTLNTRIGGHLVSGHVEGIGKIRNIDTIGDYLKIEIEAPQEILKYCIKKGSIAIDGISLTIVEVFSDAFNVVIIPHTAKMTTVGYKKVGDSVNLEPDLIAKYVEKFLSYREQTADEKIMAKLKKHGFI
ncbi:MULTISPECIES: riboflavin synthase [Thermodesulfovibrio]|jgi:riboflavin synthase|uniref:riboflavin synthase n=1 Tax=Thermodesulfovibrio TaxID=28261 RepID=UPI00261BDFE4|nr:riboflavin synthase [Thermodesulfovibrio sp.]